MSNCPPYSPTYSGFIKSFIYSPELREKSQKHLQSGQKHGLYLELLDTTTTLDRCIETIQIRLLNIYFALDNRICLTSD